MREGMVICPKVDNDGRDLEAVMNNAASLLIRSFGGVTINEGVGAWIDPATGKLYRDPVWQLTAAYEGSSANDAVLWKAAEYIRTAGAQEAVYCRYAAGNVEFVSAPIPAQVSVAA